MILGCWEQTTHTPDPRGERAQTIHPLPFIGCSWVVDLFCSLQILLPALVEGPPPFPWNKECWGSAWGSLIHIIMQFQEKLHIPHTEEKGMYFAPISLYAVWFVSLSKPSSVLSTRFLETQGLCQAALVPSFQSWHSLTCGHITPIPSSCLHPPLLFVSIFVLSPFRA